MDFPGKILFGVGFWVLRQLIYLDEKSWSLLDCHLTEFFGDLSHRFHKTNVTYVKCDSMILMSATRKDRQITGGIR